MGASVLCIEHKEKEHKLSAMMSTGLAAFSVVYNAS